MSVCITSSLIVLRMLQISLNLQQKQRENKKYGHN